jgi:hypothetical protein
VLAALAPATPVPAQAASTCVPQLTVSGTACLGSTLDFTLCAAPGCAVCIILSDSDGPLEVLGLKLPIGMTMVSLFEGLVPQSGCVGAWLFIVNDPVLVGREFFYLAIGYDPTPPIQIGVGTSGSFTVCATKPGGGGGGDDDDDDDGDDDDN